MKQIEKALINALVAIPDLVTETEYSAIAPTNFSIAMVSPKQKLKVPGLYAEVDTDPFPNADNSILMDSEAVLFALGKNRSKTRDIVEIIRSQFFDPFNAQIQFDISDDTVLSIWSMWLTARAASWNDELDLFEQAVVINFKWTLK